MKKNRTGFLIPASVWNRRKRSFRGRKGVIRHENRTCRSRGRFDTDKNGKHGNETKTHGRTGKIKQENLSLKIDTLTLHSDKKRLLRDVRKAADEKEQIQVKKEGLLEDIGVLDKEFGKRLDFINVLDKLKAILSKLLSMIPLVREFARLVKEKRDIRAASPYGYTPLGRLLREYCTPLPPRYDRLVMFPEVASWQTSKGGK